MERPISILSWRLLPLLLAAGMTLLAAIDGVDACHDLEYFRTKQECIHQFESEIRKSYDDHNDYDKSREIACCALMRANQCISRLSERKQCSNEDTHEAQAYFSRKTRNRNCESFDYRVCGSGASIVGATASLLAVAALVALLMDKL